MKRSNSFDIQRSTTLRTRGDTDDVSAQPQKRHRSEHDEEHRHPHNVSTSGSHHHEQQRHRKNRGPPHELSVLPVEQFNKPFPNFREPKEIGFFSHDSKRIFQSDDSQLKYYIMKPKNYDDVYFDLNAGYNSFIRHQEPSKHDIDDLLRWILRNRSTFVLPNENNFHSLNTDVVCWRGALTKLLCTPYETRDEWMFSVIRHNGTLYLCEFDTDSKVQHLKNETQRMKEMSYWGHKFEQYVVTKTPASEADTSIPVNNHEAFCSIVRSRLNHHSLVFGGEVDCCENSKTKYIELKTNREIENQRQLYNFRRHKLLKWWAQSFLIGIGTIVCGFRDDNGIVHRLEDFNTRNIPKQAKEGGPNMWDPAICFNFLDAVLEHFKSIVTTDDPSVAFVFTWKPAQPVTYKKYPPKSQYSFLPQWYIDGFIEK